MTGYIPILSIRPAEVVALSELPDISKDRMTPLILIKPWLGGGVLSRGLDKVHHAYGSRAWFAELDPEYEPPVNSDAVDEIRQLRDPQGGFASWIAFLEGQLNAIPVLQLRGITAAILDAQISNIVQLGRGLCLRLQRNIDLPSRPIIDALAARQVGNIWIVLDYGQQNYRLLANAIPAREEISYIKDKLPNARVSISATSFPSDFTDITSQDIFEREFFNIVGEGLGDLVFSDRGSARAVEQGGGGVPRPRIDLPTPTRWHFFRSDCVRLDNETDDAFRTRRLAAYREMAEDVVNSQFWDANLNIWGSQLIKITQLGSPFGITSPAKATACRINMHLARQSLYGETISTEEFEEDWVD